MDLSVWEELKDRLAFSALGKPALIGLAALLVMVAVFAGKYIVDAATASEFTVVHESGEEDPTSGKAEPDQQDSIFVHVSGAVESPGLVELHAGARVAEAVQAAGGFARDAASDSVNLARALEDGEQVFVGKLARESAGESGSQAPGSDAALATAASAPSASGKVNLNTASAAELQSLPGIGPSTAEKIVQDRIANGSFASIEDLKRVSGIGDKKYEALEDLVCV